MNRGIHRDVAHLSGFEPKAFRLGGGRSILLSYRCLLYVFACFLLIASIL